MTHYKNTFLFVALALCTLIKTNSSFAFAWGVPSNNTFKSAATELAKISQSTYHPPRESVSFLGKEHNHMPQMENNDAVQIYKFQDQDKALFIIAIRGTKLEPYFPTGFGDMIRNHQAALVRSTAYNPWTNEYLDGMGNVGLGFDERARNVMNSIGGKELKFDIEREYKLGKDVIIHTTGHSLGGAASQLLSFYIASYLRQNPMFDKNRIAVQNFSYNTPRAADTNFSKYYTKEMTYGFLSSFNFTNEADPVSTWKPANYNGICNDPNGKIGWMKDIGYCAHKEFPPIEPGYGKFKNHSISNMILMLKDEDNWKKHIKCMKDGFKIIDTNEEL